MKAIILAGGKGTRLAPITSVLPKPLVPIQGRPILDIIIEQLSSYGFKEIILAVGYLSGIIQAYFGDSKHGAKIIYSYEKKVLGTAGPIAMVSSPLGDTFLVMNGDVLSTVNFEEMLKSHKKSGSIATLALKKREVQITLGVIKTKGSEVVDYIEKPKIDYEVSTGIYLFEPEVLKYIKKNEYLDFPDLIKMLISKGKKINAFHTEAEWLDIGRPSDYEEANKKMDSIKKDILKKGHKFEK